MLISAYGPDGFPSHISKDWLKDWPKVIPLYKKGKKDHVENYLPISLLDIVSINHISDHIKNFIHPAQ